MSGNTIRSAVLLAGAAALVAACGGAPVSPGAAKENVRLVDSTPPATGQLASATWLMAKEPSTLDLDNDAAGVSSDIILANVCERLLQLQPDLTVEPGVAESYEWTTPTTLVFTLREGVEFHGGGTMTADDVVWSLRRHAAEGANESDEFVNVASIDKTGDDQVTVTMTQPDAVFVQALAGDAGIVLSRAAVEAQGDAYGTPNGTDACSGPLVLDAWNSGQSIVLRRFDGYWNADRASKVDEITFRWADEDALVNSLLTGEAHGTYLENIAAGARLASGGTTTVSQGPDTRVWDLMVTERGGLADPRLRRALSLALDRDGVSRAALAGLGVPAREPVGPGAWGYEADTFQRAYDDIEGAPDKPSAEDIAEAKELVADVGATTPIVVAADGTGVRDVIANAVVDAAGKIGLRASIVRIPNAQYSDFYTSAEARKQADLFIDDYFISKSDPVGFYKNGASDATVQWLLNDPAYDELVKQARAELDDATRAGLAIDLAKRWAEAMPWIPVVQSPTTVVLSDEVTGVPASGCYRYYPWAADLGSKGA